MQASLKRPLKMGGMLTFPFILGGEMGYTWGMYPLGLLRGNIVVVVGGMGGGLTRAIEIFF